MVAPHRPRSDESEFRPFSGWPMLVLLPGWILGMVGLAAWLGPNAYWAFWVFAGLSSLVALVCLAGFFIVNPNTSRVLVLFGRYRGSVRKDGFWWTNPFTVKHLVSLKAHNIASERIKVNDLLGSPIEIGTVVVWQVRDTAQALFDVESFSEYVDIQIETALREIAKAHPYDDGQHETEVTSLRQDSEAVSAELTKELQARLQRAGVDVLEARLSHLAYAPEIASAMLQRQQAAAIISARRKIVEGAVGMVEDALKDLSQRGVVELDDERKVTLVGNLLVVLCGQSAPQPVLNTGSLYT